MEPFFFDFDVQAERVALINLILNSRHNFPMLMQSNLFSFMQNGTSSHWTRSGGSHDAANEQAGGLDAVRFETLKFGRLPQSSNSASSTLFRDFLNR